ncbi:MAG: phage tail protein [Geobacter sp.]|nr:MAG: phage tail protein [Geobacter sp.]
MAEPFIGEIRLFSFGFAPQGWATCDGQTLSINQNQALYSLLGATYGGTSTTFNLPDLRGRTMLHRNNDYLEGAKGGTESVALAATSQLPLHTHALAANSGPSTTNTPKDGVLATVAGTTKYAYTTAKAPPNTLAAGSLSPSGSSASHNNMQPSLVINYCIALTGYYPPRS